MKFKVGDVITHNEYCLGFEDAEILDIVVDRNVECYKVKIPNGFATIPFHAENNYKLSKEQS